MSKLQAAEKTFEFFFNRLVKGYKSIMGRDPEGLDLIKIKQEAKTKQIDANKVVEVQFGKPFGEEVNALIKSGDVNIGTANKTPAYTPSKSQTDFEIQERYRSDNDKAIKAFEERMSSEGTYSFGFKKGKEFQLNANSMGKGSLKQIIDSGELAGDDLDFAINILRDRKADGGRTGYYGGGQAMVGEDLSEIGHGADALMARNMQLSPNGQATTSTGLNYLLGQDNETVRVPYNKGKAVKEVVDKGRRGFMKAAGVAGAGIAALKTGLLGFGKEAAPVVEKVAEAAGQAPTYFLKLVAKIKNLGTDVTEVLGYKSRQKVTKYKDYELTEDLTTGKQEIQRMKVLDDDSASYYGQPLTEETYMSYKPGKGQIDETTKGKTPPDEYEEGTALLRSDREFAGDVVEESAGISDDIFEEVGEAIPEAVRKGKADGGRIGFNKGKFVKDQLIKAGEGTYTKAQYLIERIKNTIKGSPDDKYVQETFPNFIKELEANPDLAKNENVFKELGGDLPDNQQIVVYGDDTLDFFTTSSGPKNIKKLENFMAKHNLPKDQALRIMKMEPNDQVMELTKTKFLKQKRTDNASGGIATMLGE